MQSGIGALCGLWTISEYFSGCVDVAVRVCVLAVEHMIGTGLDWLACLQCGSRDNGVRVLTSLCLLETCSLPLESGHPWTLPNLWQKGILCRGHVSTNDQTVSSCES